MKNFSDFINLLIVFKYALSGISATPSVHVQFSPVKWNNCNDYPTCKLVSSQMFEKYCDRETLRNMCPSFCNEECMTDVKINKPTISTEISSFPETTQTTTSTTSAASTTTKTTTIISTSAIKTRPVYTSGFQVYFPKATESTIAPQIIEDPTAAPEIILIPLIEAGFFREIKSTSNKKECSIKKPTVCKTKKCNQSALWCPVTSDVPKEQIEVLFNFPTDIYLLETQGGIYTNETIIHFLFQYLDDSKTLISQIFRTANNSPSIINKFLFDPPLKTNYFRITPIEYEESMVLRFEVYSKGVLYKPTDIASKSP